MSINTIGINDSGFNISTGVNLVYIDPTQPADTYKYRILCELTYQTSLPTITTPNSKTISFTQQLNEQGNVIFNLAEIFQSIVTPQITAHSKTEIAGVTNEYPSIHTLPYVNGGASRIFSWGIIGAEDGMSAFRGVAGYIDLKFWEFYSTTANGIPTKQGSSTDKVMYMFWGRANESDKVIIDFDDYKLEDSTKSLLSSNHVKVNSVPYIYLGKDDYHTIALLNRNKINVDAEPYKFIVKYYDSTPALLGTLEIQNTSASGGNYLLFKSPLQSPYIYISKETEENKRYGW